MNRRMTDGAGDLGWWDVEACTLPTAEKPLRVAEFDELFATSLTSIERYDPTRARLYLDGGATLVERTRRLVQAESSCCSFFTFAVAEPAPGSVELDIEVPAAHVDVLAALVERAETVHESASS